jgi:hypothetical protein
MIRSWDRVLSKAKGPTFLDFLIMGSIQILKKILALVGKRRSGQDQGKKN